MEKIKIINKQNIEWQVSIGEQAFNLLDRKNILGSERDNLLEEACDILGSCGNPNDESNNKTGLAIGYVQSGKTLSFTTVSALASENGFNAIIIIAGSTTKLVDQTTDRLKKDLNIFSPSEVSWKLFKNPKKNQLNEIIGSMEDGLFDENPILLVTVMKNITHLKNLYSLFNSSEIKSQKFKVLIIDDEADQASLNTKASSKLELEASAIYSELKNLRGALNNHTYLQYTATPQGPLLISIFDILSPDFVKILTPGEKYTGGKYFFTRRKNSDYPNIRKIPEAEIYSKNNKILKIPSSLEEALIYFYLTVLIGVNNNERHTTHNRTMMIHPSQLTKIHNIYKRWVDIIKSRWLEELSTNKKDDPDKQNLVDKFFEVYKNEFNSSFIKLTKQDISSKIYKVIKATPILLANSKEKNEIEWRSNYSRILVGGQILDRGFTVEGLNVTYMPRNIGVGNADTIQQRCRFFGYKKDYIDLCRIYLPRNSIRAYIDYVTHEEDLRNKLNDFRGKGRSLNEFKREFFLSPDLKLTRKSIISDEIKRYRLYGWRPINRIDENYMNNNEVIECFLNNQKLKHSHLSGDTKEQKHQECEIFAEDLINDFLTELKYNDASNSLLLNHIISLISLMVNGTNGKIRLININSGLIRQRSLNADKKEIAQLFQGPNKSSNYNGDRAVKSDEKITIQFHNLKIKNKDINVRTIAFYIPEKLGHNIFVQN